ncbi:MAG TPA: carbohydrate ABC transporter permease [Spirochaetota bacterium]|nr:carbohydrate ABC transporter permease [Spirochaetota bacterium]
MKKSGIQTVIKRSVLHIVLIAGAIIMIFPFVWGISTSLKDMREVLANPFSIIPRDITLINYKNVVKSIPIVRFFINSLIVSVTITASQLFTCSLSAYAFARLKFPFRDGLFYILLGTMMIPQHVIMIPVYIILNFFRLIDTYAAMIVPFISGAFGTFLLRQFFLTIPKELEEAATLDGCGHLRFLFRIMLPLSRPILATLAIFTFMWSWNNYLWPLIVTNRIEIRTLQYGLAMFKEEGGLNWGQLMAGTTIATVPILVMFLVMQRQFIQGITLTGLREG